MRALRYAIITTSLGLFLAAPAATEPLVPRHRIERVVEVRDVKGDAASVSGRLVNLTDRTLSDLKLSVSDTFVWTDALHSGSDPSHAGTFILTQEVPPNGSAAFTVQRSNALPTRSDGQFQTTVEVMGLRQTPVPSSTY